MRSFDKELVEIYRDVYCFVNSRINNIEYAKDITQSVMEAAIDKYSTLKKRDAFRSWIMQSASNKVKAYYNEVRKMNSVFVYQRDFSEEDFCTEINDIADCKEDLLQALVNRENKINLIKALNRLEAKYSEVIRLNYICGYNLIEISEIMNVNVNTIRTWSARGIVKLREELTKMESEGQE